MEINFRNINLNNQGVKNVAPKSDAGVEGFSMRETSQSSQRQLTSQQVLSNNVHFNVLTRAEQAVLLRDMMNLPKEITSLLALLAFNNTDSKLLQELFADMTKLILISDIQKVLDTNSKDLLNKLLKLIQPTPGNIQNVDQLKDLISTMQGLIPAFNSPNNEVLKSVILLYLPWLPLVQPQDFRIEYQEENKEEEQAEDVSLVIYITTENIGRLKCIVRSNNNTLHIQVESLNYDESIKDHLSAINKKINEEIKSAKITASTELSSYKSKEINKSERREVSIQQGHSISPKILMAAHIITKVVFEIDENISLRKKREEIVEKNI
jgi:hypothetical protein